MKAWRRYLRFWGSDIDGDVDDELRFHLERRISDYMAAGLARDEAERAARERFGDVSDVARSLRDHDLVKQRWALWRDRFQMLPREIGFAVRSLRSAPTFVVAVVLTLGIAIGAYTVISSAADVLLRRPVPATDLADIVMIGHYDPQHDIHAGMQPAEVYDLENRHDLFRAISGYRSVGLNLTDAGQPRYIPAATTTGGFFDVFGLRPYAGRFYNAHDERFGPSNVVVLSYGLWRDLTGGDTAVIGQSLQLNDSSYMVVGIAPPAFEYPLGAQLWTPHTLDFFLNRNASAMIQHGGSVVPTIARLRAGVTRERLQVELGNALNSWSEREPQFYTLRRSWSIEVRSFVAAWAGRLRPIVIALIGAAGFVILVACANVGSLYLLRTTGRAREIAVRMALGASRARIVRALAVEALVLAAAGGLLGILMTQIMLAAVRDAAAWRVPELHAIRLNPFVLASSLLLTLVVAVLCAAAPAFRIAAVDPRDALASGLSRHSMSTGRSQFLRLAVVSQIATALVLMLSCMVAARSVRRVLSLDPGFDASRVVTAQIFLPKSRYNDTTLAGAVRAMSLHQTLLDRLRAAPGIEAASSADVSPFGFNDALDASTHRTAVSAEIGAAGEVGGHAFQSALTVDDWQVDAAYFHTMGIPVLAGPGFTGHEQQDQARAYPKQLQLAVVIDRALAHRLFPGENAVGKLIGPWPPGMRVVGVVDNVKQSDLAAPSQVAGAIYFATAGTQARQTILLRTEQSPAGVAGLLRRTLADLDPELAVHDVQPLAKLVSRSVGARQVAAWLLSGFAALSLALCIVGVFGVLNYTMSQRAKELGIRLALGAQPGEVASMVLRNAAALAGTGLVVGMFAYLALQRWIGAFTYGVDARGPWLIAGAVLSLVTITLAASLPAAVRASRVDPLAALRAE
jgi:putative ABC transport system permease protein